MNKAHLISSIRWTLFTSVIRRIFTLILFFLIAAWLTKEDLGVFREYNLILVFISGFGLVGVDYLFIVQRKNHQTGLVALWQITIISSVVSFFLLPIVSPILGMFYQSTQLTVLLMTTSLFAVVEIVRRTVRSQAQYNHQFKELAWAETINVLVYSFLSILLLYFWRSLFVFVIIFYLGNLVEIIWLWFLNKKEIFQTLKCIFRKQSISILHKVFILQSKFLIQATLVSALNTLAGNAPILVLGMFVSPNEMGVFFFASQLIGVPVGVFTTAINQVLFPIFAGEKDGDIQKASSRYVRFIGLLGIPLLGIYTFGIAFLLNYIFADKWHDALALLPTMLLIYGTQLYSTPISGIPFVKKKPSWELYWNIISLIFRVLIMFLGFRYSFTYAILGYSLASAILNICFYLMSMHLVGLSVFSTFTKLLKSLLPVFIFLISYLLLSIFIRIQTEYFSSLLTIFSHNWGLLLFIFIFSICYIIQRKELYQDIKMILKSK